MAVKKLTESEAKAKSVLTDGVLEINRVLNESPDCLRVEVKMGDSGRHFYMFINNDKEASEVRAKVKDMLVELWGKGAYNYDQLARQLRVQPLDIQMCIDQEFEEGNGGIISKVYYKAL